MKKVPISFRIDDPAPVYSTFYTHRANHLTDYGEPILEKFPNSFLFDFCDMIERNGMKGKFSIVPMVANQGDIINGLGDAPREEIDEWLDTVKKRVAPRFTISPEMLTHSMAIDIKTGKMLDENENQWSQHQNRETLTPYIAKALSLLQEAGFDAFGVTSPWRFGIDVRDEYAISISDAVYEVCGKENAWFTLGGLSKPADAKAWIELERNGRCLVSIPSTTKDRTWQILTDGDMSEEAILKCADAYITEDGRDGDIIRVLESGGWPIMISHWQSMYTNGSSAGLRAIDIVGQRIKKNLSDRVEWMSFEEIMNMVIADKAAYPKPVFND